MSALLVVLCSACQKKEPARVYQFHGTVVRLDPDSNQAAIHNEKIPGWMEPMTMEYPVKSSEEFKALRPGERISAEVNVTSDGFYLTNVREEKPQ